uniref:Uncharacterized protein n=1 Tax=Cannabis sativa TaxID=3483 RepID=A0A803PH28_CANSA
MLLSRFSILTTTIVFLAIFSQFRGDPNFILYHKFEASSSFSKAIEFLQGQIGYNFKNVGALELNTRITDVSKVETSCAKDGTRLGLHKVVRVSHKSTTNPSTPSCDEEVSEVNGFFSLGWSRRLKA